MFLGIDLGTGSVKALLMGAAGEVLSGASRSYPVDSPQPGSAQTDPALWWQATCQAVREVVSAQPGRVEAIGFSGQAHGLVPVDHQGEVLHPAILWPDRRAEAELAELLALPEAIRRPLANPVALGMMALSLRWLSRHQPEVMARLHYALSPKDWLRLKMSGEAATEPSDASMTLLWDMQADGWSAPLLEFAQIRASQLPPVLGAASRAGRLTAAAAQELGLPAGLPLATGLSDCAACLLGMGLHEVGATVLQIGSGVQIMSLAPPKPPQIQPFFNTFRAFGAGRYVMAAGLNGGTAFEWAREALGASWEEMYQLGFAPGAASDGVLFLPYVAGERAPLLDPGATASWTGLRLGTGRAQMVRAVFEGVALATADALHSLKAQGAGAKELLLAGGGTRDPRWQQLLADVLGLPLRAAPDHGHAAIGAAFTAGIMAGHWAGPADLPVPEAPAQRILPRPVPEGVSLARLRAGYAALRPQGAATLRRAGI